MIIIPAIDIIGGACVRLEKGDYAKSKKYFDDPVEVAKSYEHAGLTHLHVVDLDGAKASHVVNLATLEKICEQTSLHVDFGGGVKTEHDLNQVFGAGARQVTGGSIAAKDREEFTNWIRKYGADKLILGADVLDRKIMVSGWQEESSIDLEEFLGFYVSKGVAYCVCTDISKDGMLQGPSFELYREISKSFPNLKLIASGGVSSLDDLKKLEDQGLYATIVGKAIYEGNISLTELAEF